MKHRLTQAQRDTLTWIKQTTGPNSHASRHKSEQTNRPRHTTSILVREGYVKAHRPNRWGQQRLTLTKKGEAALP